MKQRKMLRFGSLAAMPLIFLVLILLLARYGASHTPQEETASASVQVPILLYHHLVGENAAGTTEVTADRFAEHMQALADADCTPVSFDDLRAYVQNGAALPENPVVITFDDGYESFCEYALPVLQGHGFKATVYAIGVSLGKDTYKDTGVSMLPHFSADEAREMTSSGLITVGSHGYDLHEVKGRDPEPLRKGAILLPEETEADFAAFLQQDYKQMQSLDCIRADVFSYPYGAYSELSESILTACGVWCSVTTEERTSTVVRGREDSLHLLGRYRMTDDIRGADLLALLEE